MSALDIASAMTYGDDDAMRDFFLIHNIQHQRYAALIVTPSVKIPSFDVADEGALEDIIQIFHAHKEGHKMPMTARLSNWLNMHYELHSGEMGALNLGGTTDISVVDFGNVSEFSNWLFNHQETHASEDAALGI